MGNFSKKDPAKKGQENDLLFSSLRIFPHTNVKKRALLFPTKKFTNRFTFYSLLTLLFSPLCGRKKISQLFHKFCSISSQRQKSRQTARLWGKTGLFPKFTDSTTTTIIFLILFFLFLLQDRSSAPAPLEPLIERILQNQLYCL